MYEIVFADKALGQLEKVERNLKERIIATLERIRIRPEVHVKKLIGDPGFRLRVGDYRIILEIDKNKLIILILEIGHRKNIYK